MKRILTIALTLVLALLLALALAGCGKKKNTDNKPAGTTSTQNGPVKSNTVETKIAP